TANLVSQDVPPSRRPLRSSAATPRASDSETYPQSCSQSGPRARLQASSSFRGSLARRSGPASSRSTEREPSLANRLATTHPAAPPPTTTMLDPTRAMSVPLGRPDVLRLFVAG